MGYRSQYAGRIEECLAMMGLVGKYEARLVEGYMRLGRDALDDLPPREFFTEVALATAALDQVPAHQAERIARSYGL